MKWIARRLRRIREGVAVRLEQRRRMEVIDRQSDDLIEAGYYDEAEDLMADRDVIFRQYRESLRRPFGTGRLVKQQRQEGRRQ